MQSDRSDKPKKTLLDVLKPLPLSETKTDTSLPAFPESDSDLDDVSVKDGRGADARRQRNLSRRRSLTREHSLSGDHEVRENSLSRTSRSNEREFLDLPSPREDHRGRSKTSRAPVGEPGRSSFLSVLPKQPKKATQDPFDMLMVGKEYKVSNFKGSCPEMKGIHLSAITNDGLFPVFNHKDCTLTVKSIDEMGHKHLHFKATVIEPNKKGENGPGGNCNYGATGTYEVEFALKKAPNGQVICTSIKGVGGKIAIPTFVLTALSTLTAISCLGSVAFNAIKIWGHKKPKEEIGAWDEVKSYNTGKTEQGLHVNLVVNSDGTLQLQTIIDPQLLVLEGAARCMLVASNGLGIACPAIIEGSVILNPRLEAKAEALAEAEASKDKSHHQRGRSRSKK